MKYKSLFSVVFLLIVITGCLEMEEGITVKEDGSGTYEMKTEMGKLLEAAGQKAKEQNVKEDTIINYARYLDTAQSLSDPEMAMLRKVSWKMRINTDKNLWDITLAFDFKEPGEINRMIDLLQRWDNTDVVDVTLNSLFKAGEDLENISEGNKTYGDITRNYFTLDWQNGRFTKTLDSLAYSKFGEDDNFNMVRKLGKAMQAGDVFENIFITTKISLPRAVAKAEGKNINLSEDRMTINIKTSVADFIADPHNLEYDIEY